MANTFSNIFEELKKSFYSAGEAKLEVGKKDTWSTSTPQPFIPPQEGEISQGGSYGYNLAGSIDYILAERDSLISQWRNMMFTPETDQAVQEIVNEALVFEEDDSLPFELILDDIDTTDQLKDQITESFDNLMKLMDFKNKGEQLFKQWYVDGVLNFEVVYNNKKIHEGVKKIILLSPYNFFKFKNVETGETTYFMSTRLQDRMNDSSLNLQTLSTESDVHYKDEQITQVTSGILSADRLFPLSHLNKAMKVANQLALIEDSLLIYRITRAPEKKVFYIDTGRLPKAKAEEYIQNMMNKHRNKINYNLDTGTVDNQKRSISVLEDYWLPRNADGKGTQIDVLQGSGADLGEIADLDYFNDKLYRALNVPQMRRQKDSNFESITTSGINVEREEIKFFKFIVQLRKKFNSAIYDLLKKDLLAKKAFTITDWNSIVGNIKISYKNNSNYAEKAKLMNMEERMNIAMNAAQLQDEGMLTKSYIKREILGFTDEDLKNFDKDMEADLKKEKELADKYGEQEEE